jgi:hypothetical protein
MRTMQLQQSWRIVAGLLVTKTIQRLLATRTLQGRRSSVPTWMKMQKAARNGAQKCMEKQRESLVEEERKAACDSAQKRMEKQRDDQDEEERGAARNND